MNIDRKVRLRADSLHRFEKRRSCLRESATKRIIAAADGYSENRQIGHVCAGGYDADYANLHIGMYAHARMGTVLCSPLRRRSGRVSGAWPARAPAVVFFRWSGCIRRAARLSIPVDWRYARTEHTSRVA